MRARACTEANFALLSGRVPIITFINGWETPAPLRAIRSGVPTRKATRGDARWVQ
jgi:hypothetical protein